MFTDLLEFIFTTPVELLQSLNIPFGDITINVWKLAIGAGALFLISYVVRRILE